MLIRTVCSISGDMMLFLFGSYFFMFGFNFMMSFNMLELYCSRRFTTDDFTEQALWNCFISVELWKLQILNIKQMAVLHGYAIVFLHKSFCIFTVAYKGYTFVDFLSCYNYRDSSLFMPSLYKSSVHISLSVLC